jgi:hypothetical protein
MLRLHGLAVRNSVPQRKLRSVALDIHRSRVDASHQLSFATDGGLLEFDVSSCAETARNAFFDMRSNTNKLVDEPLLRVFMEGMKLFLCLPGLMFSAAGADVDVELDLKLLGCCN